MKTLIALAKQSLKSFSVRRRQIYTEYPFLIFSFFIICISLAKFSTCHADHTVHLIASGFCFLRSISCWIANSLLDSSMLFITPMTKFSTIMVPIKTKLTKKTTAPSGKQKEWVHSEMSVSNIHMHSSHTC